MDHGYIKLHRKISGNDVWTAEKFTRGQAMVDLIMLANYKDGHIRKRGIKVEIKRGEIGWSERELCQRWRWSRGKTRRFLNELCSGDDPFLVPQTVPQKSHVTAKYKIVKYEKYQANGTTDDTTDGPQTVPEQEGKEINIPEKIVFLKERYTDQALIENVISAITSTRKTNKVSDKIILDQFLWWEKHPVEKVEDGMRTYLKKKCASRGLDEKYLRGIIRNSRVNKPSTTPEWL